MEKSKQTNDRMTDFFGFIMSSNRNEIQEFFLPDEIQGSPLQTYRCPTTTSLGSSSYYSAGFRSRTPSFCSTCSSSDLTYTDSEEEDPSSKWPWIEHIQDNGDLIFIESLNETNPTLIQKKSTQEQINNLINNENKEKRLQEKIKGVIKRTRSFTKKDHIHQNKKHDKTHNHHHKKKTDEHHLKQNYKTAQIETKLSDTMNLICKNIVIQLNEKVEESFISLENVFGLISGLDFDPVLDDFDNDILMSNYHGIKQNPHSIVVQGIIPNSPVGNTSSVLIGDIILAVNGTEVNHQNINQVLLKINGENEAIITLERLMPSFKTPNTKSQLCNIVCNTIPDHKQLLFDAYNEVCGVMLLTFSCNEDDAESDIVFWYPDSDMSDRLKPIRGAFLTLSDVMTHVSQSSVQSSLIVVDDQLVNISFDKIGDDVFLVTAPESKCCQRQLQEFTKELRQLLRIMCGDVQKAFTDGNLTSTKHLISIFMEILLSIDNFPHIRQLQIPVDIYIDISNVLCDAEAADYGECTDDFFPHRRLYGTIGTCLFYQDSLICNHLSDSNLKDVIIFCKYHWLFELAKKEKLKQLVVWKEIYLTAATKLPTEGNMNYQKPTGVRWFLLVVGQGKRTSQDVNVKNQGKSLLCTLLEAGGVASVPDGNPGPHPYYVDTAWSILTYLIESVELEVICDTRVKGGSTPAIATPMEALNPKVSQSPRALELIKRKVPAHLSNDQINNLSLSTLNISGHQRQTSLDNSSLDGFVGRRESKASTASGNSFLMMGYPDGLSYKSDVSTTAVLSTKLTVGMHNTLFCFLTLKNHSGVLLCPNFHYGDNLADSIYVNFNKACERMHANFQQHGDESRQIEQGILFRCQATKGAEIKKGQPNFRYWVIGRLVKRGKHEEEIYVCFQDGVPQNVVEMAFKMRYGTYY